MERSDKDTEKLVNENIGLARVVAVVIAQTRGGDASELFSDALMGLWSAAKSFDGTGEFKGWATLCMNSKIYDAYRAAHRMKRGGYVEHVALDSTDSLTGKTLVEQIEDESIPEIGMALDLSGNMEDLKEAMATLKPRLREVLTLRFGFNGEPMTLGQTGEALRFSKQRVHVIERAAMKKLRRKMREIQAGRVKRS